MDMVKLKANYAKKFGQEYVNVDGKVYKMDVVPTGSLMLDYKLGIGGFPYGGAVEVFGGNKVGKSSALGYPVLGNVQKQGRTVAVIQVEPRFRTDADRQWALDVGGFDSEAAMILSPDHADQAFDMLRELVFGNDVNYIMIDSLGALGNKSSAQEGGKAKAYGISGATTSVLNDIMPRLHKNKIGLLILNQQRQKTVPGTTLISYDSPGGEGLHHNMMIRIQLKPAGEPRFHAVVDGEKVLVGRALKAQIIKNNMHKGSENTSATFNFFQNDTEEYTLGIDKVNDVATTGVLTGVLTRSGNWIEHPTFPANKSGEHKLQGLAAAGRFLLENEKAYMQVRQEVLAIMQKEVLQSETDRRKKLSITATDAISNDQNTTKEREK